MEPQSAQLLHCHPHYPLSRPKYAIKNMQHTYIRVKDYSAICNRSRVSIPSLEYLQNIDMVHGNIKLATTC